MIFIDFVFPSLLSFLASSTLVNLWKVTRGGESDHVRQDLEVPFGDEDSLGGSFRRPRSLVQAALPVH
jgi:hypothetical protein